jgi:transcription elongation factor Elf1
MKELVKGIHKIILSDSEKQLSFIKKQEYNEYNEYVNCPYCEKLLKTLTNTYNYGFIVCFDCGNFFSFCIVCLQDELDIGEYHYFQSVKITIGDNEFNSFPFSLISGQLRQYTPLLPITMFSAHQYGSANDLVRAYKENVNYWLKNFPITLNCANHNNKKIFEIQNLPITQFKEVKYKSFNWNRNLPISFNPLFNSLLKKYLGPFILPRKKKLLEFLEPLWIYNNDDVKIINNKIVINDVYYYLGSQVNPEEIVKEYDKIKIVIQNDIIYILTKFTELSFFYTIKDGKVYNRHKFNECFDEFCIIDGIILFNYQNIWICRFTKDWKGIKITF